MGAGFRDAFGEYVTDDIFGELIGDTRSNLVSHRRTRKKHRKRRARSKRTYYRKPKKRAKSIRRKGKRKGMSAAFLRNLRKKHHLGEFKRR